MLQITIGAQCFRLLLKQAEDLQPALFNAPHKDPMSQALHQVNHPI